MIWLFGLVTGLAFKMPLWWWILGAFMAAIDSDNKETLKINQKGETHD